MSGPAGRAGTTPPRVLYLTGWCRSGSTLLGNLLNELPGVVHVGELHYLWRNGIQRAGTNTSCGCGAELVDCPLWSGVLKRLVGDDDPAAVAARAAADQRALLRTRHAGLRLAESAGRAPAPYGVRRVRDRMVCLYTAIAAESGASVVVDSSKYPAEPAALAGAGGLDLRVLHVVRDPRATAHSWRRAKAYIPAMGAARSTAYWTGFGWASDRLAGVLPGRWDRLRYEDLVAAPRESVAAVMRLAGLAGEPPVAADGTAELGVNHTVTGNPDRLRRGPVQVRDGQAWRRELPARDRLVATALAAPLLPRYRYPVG